MFCLSILSGPLGPAVEEGGEDDGRPSLERRRGRLVHDVAVEDDKVGRLALGQRAVRRLLELRQGGREGEAGQGLGARQALLRVPYDREKRGEGKRVVRPHGRTRH